MRIYFIGLLYVFLSCSTMFVAQTSSPQANQALVQTCPRIAGFVEIIHPIATFGTHINFDKSYTAGVLTGINIWKSSKIGFSFEAVPFVRTENGVCKISNFLFYPDMLAALGKGYTFITHGAFEISGRFRLTPILNKVHKSKHSIAS